MAIKTLASRRIAIDSILVASSLIVFVVENLFPPLILPGAKLGLANIFTLFSLILFSPLDANIIFLLRIVLGNIIVGNISALMYSLPAGLISLNISALLIRYFSHKLSIISISVMGAVLHNIIQNLIFYLVTSTSEVFGYTPYLSLLGVLSGVVVGVSVYLIIKFVPTSVYEKFLKNNTKENNKLEEIH